MEAKKKVLVIDDEVSLLETTAYVLKDRGYDVLTAASGAAGFKLANSGKPNLIILDVNMPGIDGWEALKMLKANAKTKDIPVLMLTTKSMISDVNFAFALGATGYLTKPLNVSRLEIKVKELIG